MVVRFLSASKEQMLSNLLIYHSIIIDFQLQSDIFHYKQWVDLGFKYYILSHGILNKIYPKIVKIVIHQLIGHYQI